MITMCGNFCQKSRQFLPKISAIFAKNLGDFRQKSRRFSPKISAIFVETKVIIIVWALIAT
jgi:hypothetical protein